VAALGGDDTGIGGRGQVGLAGLALILSLVAGWVSDDTQQRIAGAIRGTVLRPFVAMQEGLARARAREETVDVLTARLDSLAALLAAQATLAEENAVLRDLLDLSDRLGPSFHAASVLRTGVRGSESMFLLDLGTRDGVREDAPVIGPDGLVGVVREAGASSSVAIDWTHPDFRASAMVRGTEVYGIVLSTRGAFREEDRLMLEGVAYNTEVPVGSSVVTSGLGGVYPRGIPIGTVQEVAETEGTWRRSYWLRPAVVPGSVLHVLVLGSPGDAERIEWPVPEGR